MLDLDVLGFIDHNITVNVIKMRGYRRKKELKLPKQIKNVIRCKIPAVLPRSSRSLPQISSSLTRTRKFIAANTVKKKIYKQNLLMLKIGGSIQRRIPSCPF